MAFTLKGILIIKVIKGTNGSFAVGDLITPEGDFKVKDSLLDQFEEGRYEGEFVIDRVYPHSYVWRGRSTTDIRAKVSAINLDGVFEGKQDETPVEPDPIQIEPSQPASPATLDDVVSEIAPTEAVVIAPDLPADPKFGEMLEMFGQELALQVWEGHTVKLDPTVDRQKFRAQRDYLKAIGFSFEPTAQTWSKKEVV